ncbi:hypothetical protein N7468_009759 [Penicillium chermesinum]|uniref:Zn(2)-C6 fungal-type domain-containing protein n=1 Tax=Penicillium chermesinum TaxID=63820 RepID=A0A9W9NIE8_9EURO|nr:uncharacterized protein N7468_009759 [Penicillium chermesinum]KAJ5220555.1 hypothetical protein N7468_009759 [Penicillium chermesinum]
MPGVPSNKSCERCKKKHMKVCGSPPSHYSDLTEQCDETRPQCQRCQTANVECPGYVQTRKFIDQGPTVRRRFAPYQGSSTKTPALKPSVEGWGNPTFSWNDSSDRRGQPGPTKREALDHADTNLHQDSEGLMAGNPVPMGTETKNTASLDAGLSESDSFPPDFRSNVRDSWEPPGSLGQNSAVTRAVLDTFGPCGHGPLNDSIDSQAQPTWQGSAEETEKEELQALFTDLKTGTEHETAFLMRYFTEVIGSWYSYPPFPFGAIAAKQLGLLKGVTSLAGAKATSLATTEIYPNSLQVDWSLKATNYYYLASSSLHSSFSEHYTVMSSSTVFDSPTESLNNWIAGQNVSEAGLQTDGKAQISQLENSLATVTLMIFYKLLDSDIQEWHLHLSGIGRLFESLVSLYDSQPADMPHGIRASFWNLARQDFCGSYMLRVPTHLDPTNLPLWRAAGLSIDGTRGFDMGSGGTLKSSEEDQAFNGLIWLLSKLVNFLAHLAQSQLCRLTESPGSTTERGLQGSASPAASLSSTPVAWLELCFAFQSWFEGAPETFRPYIRIERPRTTDGTVLPFPETLFSSSTCAAAMQHYHFGRIALLLNRPENDSPSLGSSFDRLKRYREVTKEVEFRCREVCSIALGRPHGAVRVHMIPLLFGVGKCIEGSTERRTILDILHGVTRDLGLRTASMINMLVESWKD